LRLPYVVSIDFWQYKVEVEVFEHFFNLYSQITDSADQLLHTLSDLGFTIYFEKACLIHYVMCYIWDIIYISSKQDYVFVNVLKVRVVKLKGSFKKALSVNPVAHMCGQCLSVPSAVTPGKLFFTLLLPPFYLHGE